MDQQFYLKTGGATALTLSAAITLLNLKNGILSGIMLISAILLIKSAERESRKKGRTEKMKVCLKTYKPSAELLMISSGLIVFYAPLNISLTILALLSLSEILSRDIGEEYFGQEVRAGLLIMSIIGFSFNQYVLFYGFTAIGAVAGFDIVYMVYSVFKDDF